MNTKTALAIFSIVALLTAVTASSVVSIAFAQPERDNDEGIGNEKNFGHCKQEKENDNPCENKFHKNN